MSVSLSPIFDFSRAILDRKDRGKASEKKSGEEVEMVEVSFLQSLTLECSD